MQTFQVIVGGKTNPSEHLNGRKACSVCGSKRKRHGPPQTAINSGCVVVASAS
jgi:hypothetical protein